MEKWKSENFYTSTTQTEQFKQFSKEFKKNLKKQFSKDYKISFNIGHFYISGFVEYNGTFVYFSTSDVRFFKNEWFDKILIRTAKNNKDYSGGYNNYSTFNDLSTKVKQLIIKQLMEKQKEMA